MLILWSYQEARTCTIVLEEDDLPTVRRMVTYLYTLTYDDEGDAASPQHYMANGMAVGNARALTAMTAPLSAEERLRHKKMVNNVAVCAIAQKYDLGELKGLATAKFNDLMWFGEPNHGLPEIAGAVFETTSITDSGLRNIVVAYCTEYSTDIIADDHLCSIITDYGELGLDVLREVDELAQERSRENKLLHQGLVTVKEELNLMIQEATSIRSAVLARFIPKLSMIYNDIDTDIEIEDGGSTHGL